MDLEKILIPVPGDEPYGTNLEYDPLYLELEELATGIPPSTMKIGGGNTL